MHWQAQADFVVVGLGAAGLMAALSASEAGKSVVLLERSEKIGGTTAFSGALLWVQLNPKGQEIGFIDDRDAAISYILATMGQSADRTRVEAFVDSAGETIEFLERHSPIQLLNTPYPDTFIEAVGGVASGRHLEPAYFSLRKLGAWRHRLRKPANPAMFTFR